VRCAAAFGGPCFEAVRMAYSQDISGCLSDRVGDRGLTEAEFSAALAETAPALGALRQAHADGTVSLLGLPGRRDDIAQCEAALVDFLRGAEHVVVFGTGGSSLGAQTLAQFAGWRVPGRSLAEPDRPAVHFADNLDPDTMTRLTAGLDLKATRFLVVSKSGTTPETVMQMLAALEALTALGLDWNVQHHMLALSEPGTPDDNAVRRLCALHDIPVLDHDPGIGGRYSVLSNVGILPGLIFGLDGVALRDGAGTVVQPLLDGAAPEDCAPAIGAAVQVALARAHGISISVLMPYADRLRLLGDWYVQLWAESLGKSGSGTTPIAAAGPVDQHSQMQLFLDGPADKLVTVLTLAVAGQGPRIGDAVASDPLVGYLAGKAVGSLVDCEQRAAAETLIAHGRPTRLIQMEALDERALGALLMHFMLETIIAGHLLGVDPFDQPAVEDGKRLTRAYLAQA